MGLQRFKDCAVDLQTIRFIGRDGTILFDEGFTVHTGADLSDVIETVERYDPNPLRDDTAQIPSRNVSQ